MDPVELGLMHGQEIVHYEAAVVVAAVAVDHPLKEVVLRVQVVEVPVEVVPVLYNQLRKELLIAAVVAVDVKALELQVLHLVKTKVDLVLLLFNILMLVQESQEVQLLPWLDV